MGQIPNYGIIGSGRLACHLAHYFSLANIPFNSWSRRHCTADDLNEFIEKSDIIILAIRDDAIEDFIEHNPQIQLKRLVHCSGSLVTDKAIGMHPLASFGDKLFALSDYQKIAFIIDMDSEFKQIFPTLSNPYYKISKENKPYYHALCVISGNFSSILWSKLLSELESKLDMPMEAAFPYIQSVCSNLMYDYKAALTGPLIRGDQMTIDKNLEALSGDAFLLIYQEFVKQRGMI